ncbi:14048_t:CDS:2, partial [Ambispora leptoticha]
MNDLETSLRGLPLEQKFAATIWWLGNGKTLRAISELCDMAESTFHYASSVCDHQRKFLNIYCDWAGLPNSYILGDSDYANTDWLLVPYCDNGHLTIIQQYYNYVHSATRIRIEQAFGIFKSRWRILCTPIEVETKIIPSIVSAYCILHNICESYGDEIEESLLETDNTFKRQENIEENYNDNNYTFIRD